MGKNPKSATGVGKGREGKEKNYLRSHWTAGGVRQATGNTHNTTAVPLLLTEAGP